MKILAIEDDQAIVETLCLSFMVGWPEVEFISAKLGEEGIDLIENENPNLVILDLGLPDISGFDVIKRVRQFSGVPIMVLTQNEDEKAIVKALEWGADEYIIKPFRQMELLARVKALTRRQRQGANSSETIGAFKFDFSDTRVEYKNKFLHLTRTEFQLLYHLALNVGQLVTVGSLAQRLWEVDYPNSASAIRVYVRHLRQKIENNANAPKLIITKPGGYTLVRESKRG